MDRYLSELYGNRQKFRFIFFHIFHSISSVEKKEVAYYYGNTLFHVTLSFGVYG